MAVSSAVRASSEKKPGPYIAEAVRQRMAREGMLPGNPAAELLASANEVGMEAALAALANLKRRKRAA